MEQDILEELKADRKTVEEWILNYEARKKDYQDSANYFYSGLPNLGFKGHSAGGSITEYNAGRIFDLEHEEKWLLAVEKMQRTLQPKKAIFLYVRRMAHQKNLTLRENHKPKENWILFVQNHYAVRAAEQLGGRKEDYWVAENTIFCWWSGIVELTLLIALKSGCKF